MGVESGRRIGAPLDALWRTLGALTLIWMGAEPAMARHGYAEMAKSDCRSLGREPPVVADAYCSYCHQNGERMSAWQEGRFTDVVCPAIPRIDPPPSVSTRFRLGSRAGSIRLSFSAECRTTRGQAMARYRLLVEAPERLSLKIAKDGVDTPPRRLEPGSLGWHSLEGGNGRYLVELTRAGEARGPIKIRVLHACESVRGESFRARRRP